MFLYAPQLFNIGALIAASITISGINELAEVYNENGKMQAVSEWQLGVE